MNVLEEKGEFFSRGLLNEIRERFCYIDRDPYNGERIFFENAGGALRLKSVVEIEREITAFPDCTSRPNKASKYLNGLALKGRDDFKLMIGAKNGKIVTSITASRVAFHITGAIIENTPGTNVVTTNLEHPASFDAVCYYANKKGIELRIANFDPVTGTVNKDEIINKVDKNTSLLSFIFASNMTGAILDVENIIKEARLIKPDIYILTDAVQHIPHASVDVEKLQIDGLTMAPYKCFSKRGLGLGYVSARASKLPHERILGKPLDEWELGSVEPSGFACLSAVVDYICWIGQKFTTVDERRAQYLEGIRRIQLQERALLERLLNGTNELPGLRNLNAVVVHFDTADLTKRHLFIAMSFKGHETSKAVKKYEENGIIVFDRVATSPFSKRVMDACGLAGIIRVTPMHYNLPKEIDTFLKVTAKIAG